VSSFTPHSPYNETMEWYTPPYIFEALNIAFDTDVCSPGHDKVPWIPAAAHIILPIDGLKVPWYGRIWMNPPYGKLTRAWFERFVKHPCGIALAFSRTDTAWFHQCASQCDAILFMRKRIRFIDYLGYEGGTPGNGSMLVANGADCVKALKDSNLGIVWEIVK